MIVELTRGYKAVIDDIDADLVKSKWCAVGRKWVYAQRREKGVTMYLHRLILERMIGRLLSDDEVVDHIDRDPMNNRRDNLRVATVQQNSRNRNMHSDNSTGFKGVSKHKNRYRALIYVGGKRINLGRFHTPEEAHEAYKAAAIKYFGEFANSD